MVSIIPEVTRVRLLDVVTKIVRERSAKEMVLDWDVHQPRHVSIKPLGVESVFH